MNWVTLLQLTMLLAAWVACGSEKPNGQADRGSHGAPRLPQKSDRPGPTLRRLRIPRTGEHPSAGSQGHPVTARRKVLLRRRTPQPTVLPVVGKLQASNFQTETSQGQRLAAQTSQPAMLKDDSTSTRSRMVRFPSTSSSPNILASFAGKNRVWIISAPHASDGYYRLMMTLLKNDVYCELAERHIQQIVLFHEEGEEGGKVRRITNEGKILEQPLDPGVIPKLMSSFKLEKGKFGMVLLKKTLQVEEKYPYPVRLEAIYEVVDQSPIRRIEKLRQKGFVQKCKAAGVEGQVNEEGDSKTAKPTHTSDSVQVPTRKEEPKQGSNVQPTREVRVKTARKVVTTAPPPPPPTTRATTIATTLLPVTTATRATTRVVTVATRPPTTTTTTAASTQRPWTTKAHSTFFIQRLPTTAEGTTREVTTEDSYTPARTYNRRERQHGHAALPSKPRKESGYDPYAHVPTAPVTTPYPYTKPSTSRFVDNRTDKKESSSRDPHLRPSQPKLPKPKPPKKKTPEKILNNEYEDKYDTGLPTSQLEEEVKVPNLPPKKAKEPKKLEKAEKAEKKKKKLEKQEKLPRNEKPAKKEKADKKVKAEKDRNKKNKKGGKSENDGFIRPATKPFVHSSKRSLATFLDYFEGKRRLLLITSPKDDNNMYVQQRDEYLETVCEMAVRKMSIITIFGTMTNSTMKIDHFQLDNEKPMKVIGDDDLLDQDLINELRKEFGMTYNDFFMVLTDSDMKVKQYYEVPIAMKSVFDLVDTFQSRIKEMEKQKKDGISCKREDKTRSLENFLSRFRWRRRLFVISAPNDEEWAYQQQQYALNGQACHLGLRHIAILKLVGVGLEGGGVLELYPINGSSSVDREDVPLHLVKDIRNYFQVSPEYFSMLLVGKDGNVKSWYPSPMWSMSIVYDLIDSMQLRRQEMAIQQSLGMRCPEDEYAGYGYHGYHHQGYQEGYQDDYRHHEGYYHGYHD